MKYIALVYYEEEIMKKMSRQEWDALNRECMACVESLEADGHYIAGEPLYPVETAATVRVRNDKATATDGPFAETREQLAGFYLLEARDRDEAIRLAGRIPPARYGSIEIRPVRDLLPEGNAGGADGSDSS